MQHSYMYAGGGRRAREMKVREAGGLVLHDRAGWRGSDRGTRRAADSSTSTSIASRLPRIVTLTYIFALAFGLLSIGLFIRLLLQDTGPAPLALQDGLFSNVPSESPQRVRKGALDTVLAPSGHAHRPAKVIRYDWRITAGDRSPDGVKKRVYLVNDAFPGPAIEARSGDTLIIDVQNALQDEGIAIHWHGLHMHDANHMDGAVGFTQDPVPAGANFTYEFRIGDRQAGTFWYHAHHQEQRADGLYGGLVVHEPADAKIDSLHDYDEERLLMIGDWYHRPATEVLAWYMRAGSFGNEPVPDSLLVNGLGAYNCSNAVPARPVECVQVEEDALPNLAFDAGKRYRLRVVNTGSLAGINLGAEGVSFTPIEVDGGNPVQGDPARTIGILYPGQRVDLILDLTSSTPSTALKVELDTTDFKYPNPALTSPQHFPLLISPTPSHTALSPPIPPYLDLSTLSPPPTSPAPSTPLTLQDTTLILLYTTTLKLSHLHNIPHAFINHSTWTPSSPPLLALPRPHWPPDTLVPRIPKDTPITIVLNNLDDTPHPFHLHGHAFAVLQRYESAQPGWPGSWNPWAQLEPPGGALMGEEESVWGDTVVVPRRGYVVLRFWAGGRGVWMLHCHVLWHMAGGMVAGVEVV